MGMNGANLGTEIVDGMMAITGGDKTSKVKDNFTIEDMWKVIGQKIVAHIQANATIATSVNVTSVSGVTTGPGVSGPGTGSGSGTIA